MTRKAYPLCKSLPIYSPMDGQSARKKGGLRVANTRFFRLSFARKRNSLIGLRRDRVKNTTSKILSSAEPFGSLS